MSVGFVYVLLNPAFPDRLKLGKTSRPVARRAAELSRQTGVPQDFLVLYEAAVSDCDEAEAELHERFADMRCSRSKEYFRVSVKEAILAVQDVERRFGLHSAQECIRVPLLERLQSRFHDRLRADLVDANLLQLPQTCALEFVTRTWARRRTQTTVVDIPLGNLLRPKEHLAEAARSNVETLLSLDDFGFINVTELLSEAAVEEILRREFPERGSV